MDRNIACENDPIKIIGNPSVRIRGRHTEVNGCLAVDWTNSGFAFNFSGTGFIISLGEFTLSEPAYIKVIIDGSRRQRFAVTNGKEKIIVEGLSEKRHRVEVLKVTESDDKVLFKDIILFGVGAALRNPPFNSSRRIEFLGDSITCGYGVLGRISEPAFHTFQQDGTYTYAYFTAEKFGADARFISNSGKGIVCNCNGDRTAVKAGEYYEYQTRTGGICSDGWEPDVFVINIGTNDGFAGAPESEFGVAAKELISKIRARYKNAHIIWLYGMMNSPYKEILRRTVREFNETDKKVYFLYVDSIVDDETEIGANGHPNVRANMRASGALYKKIRAVTGWKAATKEEEND